MATAVTIHDIPDAILTTIIAAVNDTRTRNSISLVCRGWHALDRLTRTRLALRGNVRDLFLVPTCFRHVTRLDLSLLSPWGTHLRGGGGGGRDGSAAALVARRIGMAFPAVRALTVYVRSSASVSALAPQFPSLREVMLRLSGLLFQGLKRRQPTDCNKHNGLIPLEVKLVRWHQRPQGVPLGAEFDSLFESCRVIESLDLSEFYCWKEDLPPALEAHRQVTRNLQVLDILNPSFAEGFKGNEIVSIVGVCGNLRVLKAGCVFDPRYVGFVGDEALGAIVEHCRKLRVLHLVDIGMVGQDLDAEGFAGEDVGITRAGWFEFLGGLGLVEELVLDVGKNVRDSAMAMEVLATKCPNLRKLKLGMFHGLCLAIESHLDGIALCHGLEDLSIKNCADLTDLCLIEIARGCSKLTKFEVQGCKRITVRGIRTMACLLRTSLIDVRISQCENLDAASSLQAVEPICDRIEKLHIDCIWRDDGSYRICDRFDLNQIGGATQYDEVGISNMHHEFSDDDDVVSDTEGRMRKRIKFSSDYNNGYWQKTWAKLRFLSLWISVGELLTPFLVLGLEHCPNLEEMQIKVEGDCRERPKPAHREFGLTSLTRFPKLSKMKLDCSDTIGYALTAPSGHMDLSLWERFYLNGVGSLMMLTELDYWPPQDPEVNQRSLSLPAAGLLAQCNSLRKLFVHGTTHEHFIMFLLKIENLRDVQLREDYYPAPENDMSTEMRVDSCCRFEDALNMRGIPD